ncbi:hypothetical protein SDC9_109669 [bioreactor metagenome]|uniref:Uncharacterized protein n=1 Tax=bioreactor metagenome TaxID=1076179 RepID=A0A645BDS2_9ZZZZ
MPLDRAGFRAVRAGGHDGQRLVENTAQHVAGTQATACQAQDGVEFPARLMHLERQFFNEVVVLVVTDVEMLAVFCQHR